MLGKPGITKPVFWRKVAGPCTFEFEVTWNPEWVGTEQARSFKIDGDQLQVLTPWRVMPNWVDKGMTRSIVTFEHAK